MDSNLDKADIQWKFLIGCLIRRELKKDAIDRLSMSLFNMNLLDFAVVSQNYPLCKVIQIQTFPSRSSNAIFKLCTVGFWCHAIHKKNLTKI